MKKIILLLTVTTFTSAAFAQFDIKYGAKAGANFSGVTGNVTGQVSTSNFSAIGFNAGVFAEAEVAKGFVVRLEPQYSQIGGKLNFTDAAGTNFPNAKFTFGYLAVPVLVRYNIEQVEGLGVFLGPQVGFLLNAKADLGTSKDVKSSFKSTDFAGVGGVEYQLPNMGLFFDARYQYGFGNIANNGNVVNQAASISVGYKFGTKKK